MLKYLLMGIIVGVSLLAIFEIIERVRIATGKEMLTDKILAFLEDVYHRTAPNDDCREMDWQECDFPDKVKVIYLNGEKEMNWWDYALSVLTFSFVGIISFIFAGKRRRNAS